MAFVKKLFRKIFRLKGNGSREKENGRKVLNGRRGNHVLHQLTIFLGLAGFKAKVTLPFTFIWHVLRF
jgi:hypothetical protein